MKKSLKFTVLSLVALVMAGCGRNDNSTTTSKATDKPTTQEVTTAKPTDNVTSAKPTEPATTAPAPTTVSVDPESEYAKKWGSNIANLMKAHLDGHVVPYVKLANNTNGLTSGYDTDLGSVFVSGSDYDTSYITAAKTAFEDAGWDTTTSTTAVMTATLASDDLTVVVKNGTGSNQGFITLYASWKEPFDPTKASDWPADVKTMFNSILENHTLPFVYLGTVSPIAQEPTSSYVTHKLEIIGGTWNDQILTLASTAFAADSVNTFAEGTTGWDSSASTSSSFVASAILADGARLKVELGNSSGKALMKVYYSGPFVPPTDPNEQMWSSDVETAIKARCMGKTIPWFYMGASKDAITHTEYTYLEETDLKGGEWNDAVVDLFKAALDADTSDSRAWVVTADTSYTNTHYVAETDDADGNHFKLKLYANYSNIILLEIYFKPGYNVPTDVNEQMWSDTIKTDMTDKLGGNVLPWFYMNAAKADVTSSYYSSLHELDIKGGDWDDAVVAQFNAAFDADTENGRAWSKAVVTTGSSSSKYTRESDDEDGNHLKVVLYSFSGDILLECYFTEGFKEPSGADASWSTAVSTEMTTNLGEVLPYVYLGTMNPTTQWNAGGLEYDYYYDDYEFTVAYEAVIGGTWDDRIINIAKTAFAGDASWVIEDGTNSKGATVVATKKSTTDNSNLKAVIGNFGGTSGSVAAMIVYKNSAYTVPDTATSWTTDTTQKISKYLGAINIPYLYMGKDTETTSWSSYNNYLTITGGDWHNQFAEEAENLFKAAGWTTSLTPYTNGYLMTGELTNADGDNWTVQVTPDYYGDALMTLKYKPSFQVPTDPEEAKWSDDVTTKMKSSLHGYVAPFFYLGVAKDSVTCSDYTNYVSIKGGAWNKKMTQHFEDVLTADNNADTDTSNDWTWAYDYSSSYYQNYLIATRTYSVEEDGVTNTYHITIKIYSYNDVVNMYVYCK